MSKAAAMEPFHITFSGNHPALADHFIGRPIVPGALLLSAVHAQLSELVGQPLCATSKLRFNRAVLPEQSVTVQCEKKAAGQWRFRGVVDGQLVVKGIFHSDPPFVPDKQP